MIVNELQGINSLLKNINFSNKSGIKQLDFKVKHFLESYGFIPMSKGGYSEIFHHPKLDYLLKIFSFDEGYLRFLKLCNNNKENKHLPRFRGKIMKSNKFPGTYAVRMEKLEFIPIHSNALTKIHEMISYFKKNNISNLEDLNNLDIDLEKDLIEILFKIWIVTIKEKYHLDLHILNIMQRNNTIVIIDPLTKF